MGRPPSNGGPSFRFNPVEVGEMEAILQAHTYNVPAREILEALAHRFSSSAERSGKIEVSVKQVWNWFQNRRYALRARSAKTSSPTQANMPPVPSDNQAVVRNIPHVPQMQPVPPQPQPVPHAQQVPQATVRTVSQVPLTVPAPTAQSAGKNGTENLQMEFEAKSARDGAWYDVALFLSHRSLDTPDPEALVRFSGFGPEEDEWVNIHKHVRQRSLPCESSECISVLSGDLILCFQEGKEQALYFDAHVLDAQRRRHDARGCRCRFLVRYDHDLAEEIVPLRKICRRPETDYRLHQLHAESMNTTNPHKQVVSSNKNTITTNEAENAAAGNIKLEEQYVPSATNAPADPSLAGESDKLVPTTMTDAGNTDNSSAAAVLNTTTAHDGSTNASMQA